MKVAVTYEDGYIYPHFGHTQQFKVYETEGRSILSSQVVDTNGSGHGALAGFLLNLGVEVLICGGIGPGAVQALQQAGIKLYASVMGKADGAVQAMLDGVLGYNPTPSCDHHEEGHSCGSSCGHSCC